MSGPNGHKPPPGIDEAIDEIRSAYPDDGPTEPRLVVQRASEVKTRNVQWLWRHRIPLASVSLLDGDPDRGKSTFTVDLAARVSTGSPMPDGSPCESGGVLFLSAEDDAATTIVPRLRAAGADLERVAIVSLAVDADGPRTPEIPGDVALLEAEVERIGASLMIVDPLMAYLGDAVETRSDHRVRRAMAPLSQLAERTGMAVLVVRHLTKGSGGSNPLYRGMASIGFVAAARAALMIGTDPEDEEKRVLAMVKANLSPPSAKASLSFRIVSASDHSEVGVIQWLGASESTAQDLCEIRDDKESRSALDDAVGWLTNELSSGPVETADLQKRAKRDGHSWATARRAKDAIGCIDARKRAFSAGWEWVDLRVIEGAQAHEGAQPESALTEAPAVSAQDAQGALYKDVEHLRSDADLDDDALGDLFDA